MPDGPPEQLQVGPLERPVALDGGAEEPPDAGLRAPFERLGEREPAVLEPAGDGDPPGAVGPVPRMSIATASRSPKRGIAPQCARLREGRGADDDAGCAGGEERLDVAGAPDTSGRLNRRGPCARGEPADQLGPDAARPRAVEVDDVDQPGAGGGEALDEGGRVVGPRDHPLVVAAVEPHGLDAEDVDRGNQLQLLCCHVNVVL